LLALAWSVPPSKLTMLVPVLLPRFSVPVTSVPPVSRLTVPSVLAPAAPNCTLLMLATAGPDPPPIVRMPREAPFWPTRRMLSGWLKVPPEITREEVPAVPLPR